MNVYRWESDEAAKETIRHLEEAQKNAKTLYEKRCAELKKMLFLADKELQAREAMLKRAIDARNQCKNKLAAVQDALDKAKQQLEAARARASRDDATPNAKLTLKLAEAQVASREADVRETKTQLEGLDRLVQWWGGQVAEAKKSLDELKLLWKKLTEDGARELEHKNQLSNDEINQIRARMAFNASRPEM